MLPEGLRTELEQLEDNGGVRHLHDLVAQIKARPAQAPIWLVSAALLLHAPPTRHFPLNGRVQHLHLQKPMCVARTAKRMLRAHPAASQVGGKGACAHGGLC